MIEEEGKGGVRWEEGKRCDRHRRREKGRLYWGEGGARQKK